MADLYTHTRGVTSTIFAKKDEEKYQEKKIISHVGVLRCKLINAD